MTSAEEVPVLALPREDTMRLMLAMRAGADVLRIVRERRGRAAFEDAEHAARLEAVASKHGLRTPTGRDIDEWNQAAAAGRVFAEQHSESGMTVRIAPLSGGRFGVQAGWEDHHTSTVVGSARMADELRTWLRSNSSRQTVDDLRSAAEEMTVYGRALSTSDRKDMEMKAWLHRPENSALLRQWSDTSNPEFRGENGFEESRRRWWLAAEWSHAKDFDQAREWAKGHDSEFTRTWETRYNAADSVADRRADERALITRWKDTILEAECEQARAWAAESKPDLLEEWDFAYEKAEGKYLKDRARKDMVRTWKEATGGVVPDSGDLRGEQDREQQPRDPSLAERLGGRVPSSVVTTSRWRVAEDQFTALVRDGADPQMLADVVAGIDFNETIRSPSGFAAWAMRDAVKKGQASKPEKSEDEAKREVAEEWLAHADPGSPLDRARAAVLVGQIDESFDAKIAERYPGVLDGDRIRDAAEHRAEHHKANATAAESRARTVDEAEAYEHERNTTAAEPGSSGRGNQDLDRDRIPPEPDGAPWEHRADEEIPFPTEPPPIDEDIPFPTEPPPMDEDIEPIYDGDVELPFIPMTDAEIDEQANREQQEENGLRPEDSQTERSHAASERAAATTERATAAQQPTDAARRAAGPLTPPAEPTSTRGRAPRKAPAKGSPAPKRVPKRSL